MTIEDFGGRIASVWEGMRPTTRSLVERALQSAAAPQTPRVAGSGVPYDARAEWELSRLLSALDDRVVEAGVEALSDEQSRALTRMAETCATVLHQQAQSAEVFAQLFERALRSRDYTRVDTLANTLSNRLAPSEICELARHRNPAVRALAQEALTQSPTSVLVELLSDPVDAGAAREALQQQATDYGSEEARWITGALDRMDAAEDDE